MKKASNINRRSFVKQSGIVALAAPWILSCATGTERVGLKDQSTDIGLQLYTLRNQLNEDIEGTIKAVAEIGYDYLELFNYQGGNYFGRTASEFYALLQTYGLRSMSSHHMTGRTNPESSGTLLNGFDQAIEDAVKGGQKYMVCPYLQADERLSMEDYRVLAEMLNEAGEKVKNAGMQFCYHNHDFEFQELEGQLPMYYLMDNTDADFVKVELDLYWITKAGFDPIAFFQKYPRRTPLWHVKDMAKSDDRNFTEVGNGRIDFKAIFEQASASGMEHFFVEQDQSENPIGSITTSHQNLSEFL
ncbi:MAG: sugar phosphate isomerase/epimerase [Cyclobacteriaceae bacterium]